MRAIAALPLLLFASLQALCAKPEQTQPSQVEQRIFYLLNLDRELAGLKKLEWNDRAAEAARRHAQLLATNEKLSHEFLGEPTLRERLVATAVRFSSAAENVALADDADEAHLALMYSSGHRENILSPEYTAVGIGVVEHGGRLYVTQDFIRRLPVLSEEEFLTSMTSAVNRLRKSTGMMTLPVRKDSALHDAACSTQGNPASIQGTGRFQGQLLVFTLSDPDQPPAQLWERVSGSRFHQMSVGVCFRPDEKYGNGNFWVVAVLSD